MLNSASASAVSAKPQCPTLRGDERQLISLMSSECNSFAHDEVLPSPAEHERQELAEKGILTVSSPTISQLNPSYGEGQERPITLLKAGLHPDPRCPLMVADVEGEAHITDKQTACEPIEQPHLATNTFKWLVAQLEEPIACMASRAEAGNCSNASSSENLSYMQGINFSTDLPSSRLVCWGRQLPLQGISSTDHPASRANNNLYTIVGEGPAEVLTASTETLCITGWQRFCGAHLKMTPPPAVQLQEAGRPAKVAGVRRQIVMISSGRGSRDECTQNCRTEASHDEVCLELNIGPSKLGFPVSAGCRKTLQDIHSEETSGFSKWRRPASDQLKGKQYAAQFLKASTHVQGPRNSTGILFEKLEGSNDVTSSSFNGPSRSDHELVMLCLDSDTQLQSSEYGRGHANLLADTLLSDGAQSKGTNMHLVSSRTVNAGTATPPFLGMLTNSSRRDEFMSHHEEQRSAPSDESCLYETAGIFCGAHEDAIKLMPNSLLLQAAFPSEPIPISIKSPKLNSLQHPNRRPVVRDPGAPKQTSQNHSLSISSRPNCTNMIRSLDIIPNVQEKSLVEFLHAKKHNKEHFLDKVVVKEDVYQSHPWHFTSGEQGGGRWNVGGGGAYNSHAGAAGGPGSSLYFCCSTKYTKRGNMTRNRMTKEGGRWKQQGMVQPIFYGRTNAGEQQLVEAAHKTYLSYIPRGSSSSSSTSTSASCSSSFFVNSSRPRMTDDQLIIDSSEAPYNNVNDAAPTQYLYNSGRLKHRHRMIEIALQEDLLLEKRSFQLKITPKPFLVVCILRNSS